MEQIKTKKVYLIPEKHHLHQILDEKVAEKLWQAARPAPILKDPRLEKKLQQHLKEAYPKKRHCSLHLTHLQRKRVALLLLDAKTVYICQVQSTNPKFGWDAILDGTLDLELGVFHISSLRQWAGVQLQNEATKLVLVALRDWNRYWSEGGGDKVPVILASPCFEVLIK